MTLTSFQRQFRKARRAAQSGKTVVIESGDESYIFTKRPAPVTNPFVGLKGVFGAVKLLRDDRPAREKIRARLRAKYRDR